RRTDMTSRSTTIAAALGAVLGCGTLLATTSMAGAPQGAIRAAQSESETVSGVIEEVNADSNEFVLKVKEAAERADETSVTIKVNDETRYTLDGKDSTMVEAL